MAKIPNLYCSFCRRSAREVDKLAAGPGVYICDRCVADCQAVMKGKAARGFAGWDSLGDDELLSSLVPAGEGLRALDASIRDQVQALRGRGITWQAIADQLGVTRQAAQQRFSS